MSFTGVYSGFRTLDGDAGVRVLDHEAYQDCRLADKAVTTREKCGGYPRQEYIVIWGFETHDPPDAPALRGGWWTYSLERVAIHYDTEGFEDFWASISEFTEPFWFWHAPAENAFPRPWELIEGEAEYGYLYCVLAMDGECEWIELPICPARSGEEVSADG